MFCKTRLTNYGIQRLTSIDIVQHALVLDEHHIKSDPSRREREENFCGDMVSL